MACAFRLGHARRIGLVRVRRREQVGSLPFMRQIAFDQRLFAAGQRPVEDDDFADIAIGAELPGRSGRAKPDQPGLAARIFRSEEHTSELQSLMRISYAVFCLKKKMIPPLKSQS